MTAPTLHARSRECGPAGRTALLGGALPSGVTRARRPLRVGLFGLFGCGNTGNDGSLEAMLDVVRRARPDAEILCICSARPGAAEHIAASLAVRTIPLGFVQAGSRRRRMLNRALLGAPIRLASLIHAVNHLRKLDVLLVPGTGILDDFSAGPSGMPLALFVWCLAARLCGTRLAFVSIGAGPIEHPLSRKLMKAAVAMAAYRSYRDCVSRTFMEQIGFDARSDPVYPDLAFLLPAPASERSRGGPRLTVGVGVMTYFGWRSDEGGKGAAIYAAYMDKIAAFAIWVLDQGHCLRILSGDLVDKRAVDDLTRRLANERPDCMRDRVSVATPASLHELMRAIAITDVVVATRFHNVVCALKLGRPTISLGYAAKNAALLTDMGLVGFDQHIERIDLGRLKQQFMRMTFDLDFYKQKICQQRQAYEQSLAEQNSLLISTFIAPDRQTAALSSSAFTLGTRRSAGT